MSNPLVVVRKITDAEASVVERALDVAAVEELTQAMRASVKFLQVVGQCGCGCASVDFAGGVKGQIPCIVADAVAKSHTGEHLGIIIWALEDHLTGLEIYNYSDNPALLPVVTTITSYREAGSSSAA